MLIRKQLNFQLEYFMSNATILKDIGLNVQLHLIMQKILTENYSITNKLKIITSCLFNKIEMSNKIINLNYILNFIVYLLIISNLVQLKTEYLRKHSKISFCP